jgi:hypothetical protein
MNAAANSAITVRIDSLCEEIYVLSYADKLYLEQARYSAAAESDYQRRQKRLAEARSQLAALRQSLNKRPARTGGRSV